MLNYIVGTIKEISDENIVIETNNIAYNINIVNNDSLIIDNQYKIYIYLTFTNEQIKLYGFKEINEKILFLNLINVKGIGPKLALNILKNNDINIIIEAINKENINYLKKLPGIGYKMAQQIILDLKGKLNTNNKNNEVKLALKSLGLTINEINELLTNIDPTLNQNEIIKLALKNRGKKYE